MTTSVPRNKKILILGDNIMLSTHHKENFCRRPRGKAEDQGKNNVEISKFSIEYISYLIGFSQGMNAKNISTALGTSIHKITQASINMRRALKVKTHAELMMIIQQSHLFKHHGKLP